MPRVHQSQSRRRNVTIGLPQASALSFSVFPRCISRVLQKEAFAHLTLSVQLNLFFSYRAVLPIRKRATVTSIDFLFLESPKVANRATTGYGVSYLM